MKMDFHEVLRVRRSVRVYKKRSVEEEKMTRILEAASSAPSAGNLQAFEIFLVNSSDRKTRLAKAALDQDFIAQAPVVLVFCANPVRSSSRYGRRGVELYSVQDATIAASYAQLAATDVGLASVWVGAYHDNEVRQILGIKQPLRPVAIIAIGYPSEEPEKPARRSLEELLHIV